MDKYVREKGKGGSVREKGGSVGKMGVQVREIVAKLKIWMAK